ncbi:MAG: diguanylate cyclase [Anaerosporomusa subterranea]|jgi:diguanylate cyclase (GGDEF)-like protein|nr:diguanylate cyclase [Anaerosporomusa subterranea]
MSPLEVNSRPSKVLPLYLTAGILSLCLLGFFSPLIPADVWHTSHNVLVFPGIILGFIVFFLTWYGTIRMNGMHITILSLAILWVSVLDSAHLLTSPLFSQTSIPEKLIVWQLYWVFSRLIWACGMLYAAKTRLNGAACSTMQKAVLAFAVLLITVFTANIYLSTYLWPFAEFSRIVKALIQLAPYSSILVQTIALFLLSAQAKNHSAYHFLSRAIVFGILTDGCFAIALHNPTGLSLVGHVFRLFAYYYLLRAVYIIVIRKPYEEVETMKDEMEALATNNEHLYQASLKQCDLMEDTLAKLGTLISSRLNLDDTYRAIADMITDMMDAGQSCVALAGENRALLQVVATHGISAPPEFVPFDDSLAGAAITARKAQIVNDLTCRPELFRPQLIFSEIQAIISAPLFDGKQIIGGVEAYASEKNAFSLHDCLLLQALGRHAGAAIASARQYEETKVRLSEEQFLYQISQAAASTIDPDTILTQCLPFIMQALYADSGICLTCSNVGNLLFIKATINYECDVKEIELEHNQELAAVIRGLKPGLIAASELPGLNVKRIEGAKLLSLPLVVDHHALGVILLSWQKNQQPEQCRLSFAALMAQQIALGLEKAQLYNQVKAMALSDGLTGLANRRNFDMFLDAELRRATSLKRPLSLIMFDLDRFKSFNDTYGHLTGDKLLAQVGQILCQNVRGIDLPARYGGEEFSIILPECSNAEAMVIAEKIRQSVELSQFPDSQGSFSARITASLGIATYNPLLAPDPPSKEQIIAIADKALYRAKEEGRNRVNNATVLG